MKELIEIQSELKAPKNLFNKFGGYNYRNAEGIMEAVKPLLKKYDCFMTISDEIRQVGERYYLYATATIVNKDGKSISVTAPAKEDESKKGLDGAQLTGSTSSYARKYALNGLFLIDDTKDPDTNELKVESEAKAKEAAKAKAATLDEAIAKMTAATNRAEFEAAWKAHPEFHKDTKFLEYASTVGKKFPKQQQPTLDI